MEFILKLSTLCLDISLAVMLLYVTQNIFLQPDMLVLNSTLRIH